MTFRVLHIFPPSLKKRFSGDFFKWRSNFENWNDPRIVHFVLDSDTNQSLPASQAFNFDYPYKQKASSKWTRLIWIFKLLRNLIKFKGQYDLLHFHVLWWGSLFAAYWAKRRQIPCLYESVLLEADTPGQILKERFGRLKVSLMKNFSGFLTISEFLAADYRAHGFSDQQVSALVSCVDTVRFRPVSSREEKLDLRIQLGLPEDATLLVFVGSAIERKGIDLLVHAFIKAAQDDPNIHLLVVGPCNTAQNPSLDLGLLEKLQEEIAAAELSEKVHFPGLIKDQRQVADYYRASDIFVFPSRNEGLGNVILEAMASGLPVIVSDLPVIRNIVINEMNSLVVAIGDEQLLSEAIIKLAEDPGLQSKLAQNGLGFVRENHSFPAWQDALSELYRNLFLQIADRRLDG